MDKHRCYFLRGSGRCQIPTVGHFSNDVPKSVEFSNGEIGQFNDWYFPVGWQILKIARANHVRQESLTHDVEMSKTGGRFIIIII